VTRGLVAAAAVVLLAAVAVAVDGRRDEAARATVGRPEHVPILPATVPPAFTVRTPRPLADTRARHVWATVLRGVPVRQVPDAGAKVVGRLETRTPEGTTGIVLVLGSRANRDGRTAWVRVRFPNLGRTVGWVPRAALGTYGEVDTTLVVDTQRFRATLLRGSRAVFSAPIGIGTPASPTPKGRFYVKNRLDSLGGPVYGPVAFGTSARSTVLTDWPGGGFVGIHGTDRPELLPGRVSHGCIRMRNPDIVRLSGLMPVGTPVIIH
jgi:lipoprotein-anchoring transpeptidase ErfK/SrfK